MTTVYESNRFAFQVSWGSILAGSAVALVTYLIFSVLGTAIGSQAVDMMQKGNPLSGFGTGTGIWLLVSTLASLAAAESWALSAAAVSRMRTSLSAIASVR